MAMNNKHTISWSTMISYIFLGFLTLTVATVQNAGRFSVVYAPKYVKFLNSIDTLNTEEIPSIILSTLGLPLSQDIRWNGLAEGNPFRRPKANVLVTVLQDSSISEAFQPRAAQQSYSTSTADGFYDIDSIINHIQLENWKEEPFYVDFSAENLVPSIRTSAEDRFAGLLDSYVGLRDDGVKLNWFTTLRLGSLNLSLDVDLALVGELYSVMSIISNLRGDAAVLKSHSPDFLHFTVQGLQTVQSTYGLNSQQVHDAKHLINDFISEITEHMREIYKDSVVVEVVSIQPPTGGVNLVRKSRSLLETSGSDAINKTLNLAPMFTNMYAPIFNIVLWFMIGFALAIFAIAWGMWNMDPGRDSLIYRMTSQRMKRD